MYVWAVSLIPMEVFIFSLMSPPIYGERAERAARERALRFRVSFRVLLSRDFSRLPPLAGCVEVTVTIVLFQHHRVYASARKHGSQEPWTAASQWTGWG